MKKFIFYILFNLFAIGFFNSCVHDVQELKNCDPPTPSCEHTIDDFSIPANNKDSIVDFINCLGGLENYINVEQYGYFFPCFNPNNNQEIAYMRTDFTTFTGCDQEIWVFNFCTGETRFVTDGICYDIDWSVKDWIVFTGQDRQLWKVKSNGDSLTRLTNSGNFNNNAMWNSTGDKIAFAKTGNTASSSFFLLIDENGVHIDTIPEMLGRGAWHWSPNDSGFSCMKGTMAEEITPDYFDLEIRQYSELPPVDATQHGFIQDTDWLNEKTISWLSTWLVGTTDITTKEVIHLTYGYQNRFYHNLAVSSEGEFIITEREDMFQISACDVEVKHNLYIMNSDGTNERKINIPE